MADKRKQKAWRDRGKIVVRGLIDEHLTTIAEIARVTGRGQSTVRRWVRDESVPDVVDFHAILTGLANDEARARIVHHMFSNLPVAIHWMDEDDQAPQSEYDYTTKALFEIACVMQRIREFDTGSTKPPSQIVAEIEHLVGEAVAQLFKARDAVRTRVGQRRQAKPLK
jgi:transcriptional regulator with XRE-family HTH domain